MSKPQRVLVFAALLILAALLVTAVGGLGPFAADERGPAQDRDVLLESDAEAPEHVVGLKGAGREGEDTPNDALPAPVDLERVDRARDLHGIVVRADDTPVAGAALQAVYYPWRYGRLLTDGGYDLERRGASSRSARDGTFALRLRRGDHAHLRVSADGLATTEFSMLQAGEFVRVVLKKPVRLVIEASTPSAEPAAGLALRIFRLGRSAVWFERSGTTDTDGRFVFEDLPPGGSVYLDPRPQHEGWGDPGWIRVSLPDAGEATHAFTLPEGRTLRGTVTDQASGEPIAGARVGMNWVLVPETKTDTEGHYVLHGWSGNGVSDIHVLAEGYGREKVEVGAQEVLDFQLTRGQTVAGRVLDPDGKPLAGAQVMAVGSERGGGLEKLSMDHAWSDEEGRFLLSGLRREMMHVLTVIARGYAQGLGDIPPQPDAEGIDLGDVTLGPPRELAGTLHDSAGTALARVMINLRIDEPGKTGYRRGRAWERRSDDLGRFLFGDLPPGTYTVATRPEGGAGLSKKVRVLDRDEPSVVALVQTIGREVRIQVTDAKGKPVSGVYLYARGEDAKQIGGQTGDDGAVALSLAPGPVTVQVVHFGERSYLTPKPITVGADQSECAFVLEAAATTTGTLFDPAGKPLPWATLAVEQRGLAPIRVWTGAEGAFQVLTKPETVFSIVFRGLVGASERGRYSPREQPMEGRVDGVRAGAAGVVLRATAVATDGSLRVRVLDPEGNPLEGLGISLDPGLPSREVLHTDADGRLAVEGLIVRPTRVGVFFSASPEQPWLRPKLSRVTPDGREVVLRLRMGALIQGTLQQADGSPAVAGFVAVWVGEKRASHARVDPQGRFLAVVDPEAEGPLKLSSQVRLPDGTFLRAEAKDVRAGDTGVVLRLGAGK